MASAYGNRQDGLAVFLHFYTKKVCLHEKIIFYPGEQRRIRMPGAKLGTAFPLAFLLEREGEAWKIDRRILSGDAFCILKTQAGEEVTVILSSQKAHLGSCGKILLHKKTEIRAGCAFQNEIFYDCFSFIEPRHIRIYREKESFVLEGFEAVRGREMAGMYINGKAVSERRILEKGDRVELWGLSVLYLGEILICTAFYGALRTAERKEPFHWPEVRGKRQTAERILTESTPKEDTLHAGELELAMPQNIRPSPEDPLVLSLGPSLTMMVPVILTAVLGSALMGGGGADYYKISIVMTVSTALFSIFWGLANHRYRKTTGMGEIVRKKEIYREYLSKTEKYLSVCLDENQKALVRKYPSCESILEGKLLWNRTRFQEDFLFVRLGLGEIPFQIQIRNSGKNRELDQDLLAQEAYALMDRFRTLPRVPVGIDLERSERTGFAGDGIYSVLLQALVQLAACHSGRELKIGFFYDEQDGEEKRIAECLKWLPHVWSRGRRVRFLAGNEKEDGDILTEIRKELGEDTDTEGGRFYLLVAAGRGILQGEGTGIFYNGGSEKNRVYVWFADRERERLPGCCSTLVIRDGEEEMIIRYEKEKIKRQLLAMEECRADRAEEYMRRMAGVWREEKEDELKEKVSFLDLYSCREVEELNCCGRWRENQTRDRMRVPVGMGRGGKTVYLDVHEKYHGPHGLIAGTTGSGKSELLQTYLLSLAVSFGPEDINFFIIDYKGGGMGNVLSSLPHCAGVISNLSGRQIKRALSSIKSENRRRQRLFNLCGVNHVEDYTSLYREGKTDEPVPHLLLVVDEFAELKKEEPEFMQEIISVAQVGRSLGVHLILSTQKPAGTVDDKIWSNTRFRLCLRVAERQDSLDMLHRPEAAYLTGAGQCYIQVGNNELYELFQAGYGGGEYEGERQKKDSALMVIGTGKRLRMERREKRKGISQTEAVAEYICRISRQTKSRNARKLWMPELPEKLSLNELATKEADGEIRLCLGLCDDPERQMQYPLFYEPQKDGHLLLCGGSATGKSTFVQTILWQLCRDYSPKQVRIAVAGADNAGVACFEAVPHCLGIMKSAEEAECFFYHMERLFEKRKERLRGINFQQYIRHGKEAESVLVFAIDGYGGFRELTQDRYQGLIEKLSGEGVNCGIYLILTSSGAGSGEIPGKLFEKIKTTLSLEMSDRFQYGDILRRYQVTVWPRENVKGRGLCRISDRILEFQAPLIFPEDDYQRIGRIEELGSKERLRHGEGRMPERFPVIPQKPRYHAMAEEFQRQGQKVIPLGYGEISGYIRGIAPKEGGLFLISGAEQTGKRNLLLCMAEGLWKLGRSVALFDRKQAIGKRAQAAAERERQTEKLLLISDGECFAGWLRRLEEEKDKWCLCLCDFGDFSKMLCGYEAQIQETKRVWEQMLEEGTFPQVIALQRPGKEAEAMGTVMYELFAERQCGIHLGGNAGSQRILNMDDLGYLQMSQAAAPGIGYFKEGPFGRTERIRIPLYDDIG